MDKSTQIGSGTFRGKSLCRPLHGRRLGATELRFAVGTAIVGLAVYLRLRCALDDFWLDEIWSLNFARSLDRPWDAFLLAHDNNHLLNTIYLALLGERQHWVWYRFLSILSGSVMVCVLAKAPLESNRTEGLAIVGLAALSYPLILYASEARGYSPAALFAVLSYLQIQRYWRTRRGVDLVLWWVAVAMGLLSHLTMVYVLLALGVWTVARELDNASNSRVLLRELAKQYGPLLLLVTVYYLFFIGPMVVGGGIASNPFGVIRRTLGLSLGIDQPGTLAALVGGSALIVVFVAIFVLQRERHSQWVFFLWVLVLAPALLLIVRPPKFLYPRYFLICMPFLYVLLGHLLVRCWRRAIAGKLLCAVLLALYCVGHGRLIADQFRDGRGSYNAALHYIARRNAGPVAVVGTDRSFGMILDFYARYLPPGKRIRFVTKTQWSSEGPDWVLTHSQEQAVDPPRQIRGPAGHGFRLVKIFRYARLSGWHWFLYRRL